MNMFLHIFLLGLGLWAAYKFFRYFPKLTGLAFIILPLSLATVWLDNIPDTFRWIKIISVVLAIYWLITFRISWLEEGKLAKLVVYLFLVVNIFEAVVQDFLTGHLSGYLNAAAGILLIITLSQFKNIYLAEKNSHRDLHWQGMTLPWIIGYTIWNWVFVYLNFIQHAGNHLAVLGTALIIGIINNERWFQARTLTLGTYLIYLFTFKPFINQFNTAYWANENVSILLAGISFAFMLFYSSYYAYQKLY